ncbi:Hypothetical predicted protein [Pelobates cultripes]|uniref:Uncharacterized protein n=1 Tax=Pelobates cultripes TaxID=61616 RepID=A0AAD1SMY4_PELCU|nr:Hypothetical predicted protein [Pelobates cultripes]
MENHDLPPDVILLLRDAELFLTNCLQYEPISSKGQEIGEQILNGFRLVRKRYDLDVQQTGSIVFKIRQFEDGNRQNTLTCARLEQQVMS